MERDMLNFTVGPVQINEDVRKVGAEQVPYFRTEEFSNIMFENEKLMLEFVNAPADAKTVFLTGSGTASMEAVIINCLTKNDKALIINGGSFGKRFVEICSLYDVAFDEIRLKNGQALTEEMLKEYENKDYTTFIVNVHETSTGVLYDMNLISDFCKSNNIFLIVDAISSFLADEFNMKKYNVDVMITSSQKALACPPGISIIVLSKCAIERINKSECQCMYLNLKSALNNMERGQTPFTPAVGILLQINIRLKQIKDNGGVESEINRVNTLALDFRKKISDMPFEIVPEALSNAVTCLHPLNVSAYSIFLNLKDKYNIWVCPNGGDLKEKIFRVGHIGDLTLEDNNKLINALLDMENMNLI